MTTEAPAAPEAVQSLDTPAPADAPAAVAPTLAEQQANQTKGRFPTPDERRSALAKAFVKPTTPELAGPVDNADGKADTEPQQAGTPPASPTEETPAGAAEASAPQAAKTPKGEAAAAVQDVPPVSTDGPAPKEPAKLPVEYQTADHTALYQATPLLERTVKGIWGDPNLSEVAKVQKIEAKLGDARAKLEHARTADQEEARLWEEGDFETLRERELAKRDKGKLTKEAEATLVTLLAQAAGVEPDDEGFANAGAEAQTTEERVRAFGEWLAEHSPVGREALSRREASLTAKFQTDLAAVKAQHETELKALRTRLQDQSATDVVVATAAARAGNPPPRGSTPLPPGVEPRRAVFPTIAERRQMISDGLAARAN